MLSRVTINIIRRAICDNARTLYCAQSVLESNLSTYNSNTRQRGVQKQCDFYVGKRFKSNKKKPADKDDSDEDTEDEADEVPAGSTLITKNIQNTRMDLVYKAAFGLSRNKIEEAFYASLFRVNGKKVKKKSIEIKEGDEIDLILHRDSNNPAFLRVNRIVILSLKLGKNDSIQIKMSKDKNLLIEDYDEPWTSSS
ncbi:uncharacterized protein C6orf203 homolog [Pseudomyrmex gracilis]|uniref:uncharacterized protein C6orf203 homolog n=1 Tax=Pseudomyrmex gracilis TaxID=219809 RepID=UPI000994F343|nr:uncharacterized protein C6orf203 homolog [Pseudomyrmex gracilis]